MIDLITRYWREIVAAVLLTAIGIAAHSLTRVRADARLAPGSAVLVEDQRN